MPDDTPEAGPPRRISIPIVEPPVGGIAPDPVDVRDRAYEPTLAPLAPFLLPSDDVLAVLRDPANAWGLPRTQGPEGTCGGQALAALIDAQRIHARVAEPYQASARMIYECARLTTGARAASAAGAAERQADDTDGVSLRDVIKAFYNYGVCREALWPYAAGGDPGQLSVERARDAKSLSLGAYYRLRPNLNTYHAALHETGAVVVSAELHDGWLPERVKAARGAIVPPRPGQPPGTLDQEKHAFVVVGYTPEGFLVLNSWGRDWGGWAPKDAEPIPGVALWRYEDWADTVMDGWVLRLGVGAAEAFQFSIGDQGLGFRSEESVRATPVHAILGNFLHLDDGDFVASGAFVSTRHTLEETRRLLEADAGSDKPYQGVLLTFAGGLVGLRGATDHVARYKRQVRDAGWYPFSVLWCVDYVEQSRAILEGVFAEATSRAGLPSARLDRVVEEMAHGVGRAIWRDIARAADSAARPDGPLHDLARAGAALRAARPGFGLRLVAESEGAIAVAALLRAMRTAPFAGEAPAFFAMLETVDLIAPPLSRDEFGALAAELDAGWGEAHPDRRLRVHLPSARDEKRLTVSPYGLSYFDLVARAFRRDPDAALRPAKPASRHPQGSVGERWDGWRTAPRTDLVAIEWPRNRPPPAHGSIDQVRLVYRSDVSGRLKAILRRRTGQRALAPAIS
ncbi:MAG: C1 family peptidase [Amaricoccus sp.]